MTKDEWANIAEMIRHGYLGPFPEEAEDAYWFLLRKQGARDVATALERYLAAGSKFRPAAPDLILAVQRAEIASPEEAWALIVRAIDRCPSVYHQDRARLHQEAIDWLAGQDRVVAAYAARRGLIGPGSLGAEDVLDPQFGGAVTQRIRGEFREWAKQVEARVERGLPPVEDRMLLIRQGEPVAGGMGALMDHLRPPGQIGPGEENDV